MKNIAPANPETIAELKASLKARKERIEPRLRFLSLAESLERHQFVNVAVSKERYRQYKNWASSYSKKKGKDIRVRMISDEICRISRV